MTLSRIATLTLLCCTLLLGDSTADAATFEIQQNLNYARMTLPSTLGESTFFDWGYSGCCEPVTIGGLPVDGLTVLDMYGTANIGPLLSLNEEWNPEGSEGEAYYVFGKGDFELILNLGLSDGSTTTMTIRGTTGPLYLSGDVSNPGGEGFGSVSMSVPHATLDRHSAELFGVKRRLTGSMPFFADVWSIPENERWAALYGGIYFNYEPRHAQSADLNAVPEPATLALVCLGVAGAFHRRKAATRNH